MDSARLLLGFKGDREYAQGPDILDGMAAVLTSKFQIQEIRSLRFNVHRMTSENKVLMIARRPEKHTIASPDAALSFTSDGVHWSVVASDDGTPIKDRRPYDETPVVRAAVVDRAAQAVTVSTRLDYTDVELWTALNKRLLQTLYPEKKGRWLFVRCELDRYSLRSSYQTVELRLVENFHFKLTQTEIRMDDSVRGNIYFALR